MSDTECAVWLLVIAGVFALSLAMDFNLGGFAQ
jgi:hypothetical protein